MAVVMTYERVTLVNEPAHVELPLLEIDAQELGSLDRALTREWLVTNGAGGYAMGTIAGATTRVYHGYLIAAPRVPQERIALVTQLNETVMLGADATLPLGVCEHPGGHFAPQGYPYLTHFALDGLIPRFTYQLTPGQRSKKLSGWSAAQI